MSGRLDASLSPLQAVRAPYTSSQGGTPSISSGAKAPYHRQLGLFHGQRLFVVFLHRINRLSRFIAMPSDDQYRNSGRPHDVFQHAQPSAQLRRGTVACTGCRCATVKPRTERLEARRDQNLRLLAQTPPSRGTNNCTSPLPSSGGGPACRFKRSVVRAFLERPRRSIFCLQYCSALPPRCIFLHICLWTRRLLVMLASGITVPGATSNAPRRVVGQWGGAGGAVVRIILRGELLGFAAA